MRYLKEYVQFDSVNEKITWKQLIMMLTIVWGGDKVYKYSKDVNHLRAMYNQINSPDSNPTKTDDEKLELIRTDMIQNVKNSNLFKKFGKEWIIDSLQNVNFRVMDDMTYFSDDKALGCYIYLPIIKAKLPYKHKFVDQPNMESVIIINRESLFDNRLSEILTHELYHYLDRMLGGGLDISDSIDLEKYVDKKCFVDRKYGLNKFLAIYCRSLDGASETTKKGVTNSFNNWFDSFESYGEYMSKNVEIFARWETFRNKMCKLGYLNNSNQPIDMKILVKYVTENMENLDTSDMELLFILKLDKIEEFDSILN